MDSHGTEGCTLPNADPRWPHNVLALDAQALHCGRLASASASVCVAAPLRGHAPGAPAQCAALAASMAARLQGLLVRRGDESDHAWFAFSAPALAGAAAALGGGLVTEEELRAACGGALSPHVRFKCSSLEAEVAACRAAGEPQAGEADALQALCALAQGAGAAGTLTFFRPVEPHGIGLPPSVYAFFILCRLEAGLCGVAGFAVWT